MINATPFEFRFRYPIHCLLFGLGFWAPWALWDPFSRSLSLSTESTWLALGAWIARDGWLTFQGATVALLGLGILCAGVGAFLRTWGAAYLSSSIVQSSGLHGGAVIADGPYRYMRNPLYAGTFLHALALALLMPPSGAVFVIVTIGLLQLRLIFAEEPFLAARLGQPYRDYCARVPRLLPAPRPRVAASGARPQWLQAILGEFYMIAVALSFAILGWRYNASLLTRCVIISLGVSLLVRALLPRATRTA